MFRLFACTLLVCSFAPFALAEEALEPIARRLPPPSDFELPADARRQLETSLKTVGVALDKLKDHELAADVAIYHKAVELALRWNEFYGENDIKKARTALTTALQRARQLQAGEAPWSSETGLVVRGYISPVDGSPQPYGLEIPEGLDLSKPQPLYVWLHGRGDKNTDLHYIHDRANKKGQIAPEDAIVVHPFGRQCIGFKSAGETDVLDVVRHVSAQYNIDPRRIVLMGFSMGGAGAWHIGAHYTDNFVALSPGAGFSETARYTNLKPQNYPPKYEQTLWQVYDVPNYTRNLFNLPVVAYSGENDKQIQAARVMEEAFQEHGQELAHLIGPKMGHKYAPETLDEILVRMKAARDEGLNPYPATVNLQTPTLRYNQMHWVTLLGLNEHWQDSRVDAHWESDDQLLVMTQNASKLRLDLKDSKPFQLKIDGDEFSVEPSGDHIVLVRSGETWQIPAAAPAENQLRKAPGLQGPIDDAFLEPFLVVLPSGKASSEQVQRWVEFELNHLEERWSSVFRGKLRVKKDTEVTQEDLANYHLVCWGTPESNRALKATVPDLPLEWTADQIKLGAHTLDAAHHVPVMIYPNPRNPKKYLVINSGPTFREDHDRTNSLQNPKLPDWALIDLRHPPTASAPGKVVAADFFDEAWQVKP